MPTRDPQALTDFQESVCELCADMILRGGDEEDVSGLLRSVIGHSLHRRCAEADPSRNIAHFLPRWRKRLARYWPKEREPEHALPKTVTEMVRANLRRKLEDNFSSFLARARMHELYLMNEVLEKFESEGSHIGDESAESMLARAFLYELVTDYSYLKVPDDHVEAVEEFLKHIDEAGYTAELPGGRPQLVAFPVREPGPELPNAS